MRVTTVQNSTAADDLLARPVEYRFSPGPDGLFTARVRVTKLNAGTFAALEALDADTSDEQATRAVAEALCALVIDWNLTDENDSPVPVTVDAVADVDAEVLSVLMAAVIKGATTDPLDSSNRSERRKRSQSKG